MVAGGCWPPANSFGACLSYSIGISYFLLDWVAAFWKIFCCWDSLFLVGILGALSIGASYFFIPLRFDAIDDLIEYFLLFTLGGLETASRSSAGDIGAFLAVS